MYRAILSVLAVAAVAASTSANEFADPTVSLTNARPSNLCSIQVPATNNFSPDATNKWFVIEYNNANGRNETEHEELLNALGLVEDEHRNKTSGLCMTFNVKVSQKKLTIVGTFTKNGKSVKKTIQLKQVGNSNAVYQGNTRNKNGDTVRTQITVFDTDNKSYLVWSACSKVLKKEGAEQKQQKFQSISVLAKTSTYPQPQIKKLEQKITSLGFNAKNFKKVDNTPCKKYE